MSERSLSAAVPAAETLRRAVRLLSDRLPRDWSARATYRSSARGPRSPDAVVELVGPDRSKVLLALDSKRGLVTRDLPGVLQQLEMSAALLPGPSVPVVVSPYLSSSVRTWLDQHDVSYLDTTGNVRLTSRSPAVYLSDRGADRDPWRGPGRPRGTLRGTPAARVVRALADYRAPLPVTGLVELAGSSTGATYRVLDFLEQEALLTRGARGVVEAVRWRELLERWSQDYSLQGDNLVGRFLQPRGTGAVIAALAGAPVPFAYAVTGSLAAARRARYAPARLAAVYVDDLVAAAEHLGLREVDTGANVLLAAPPSDLPFQRTDVVDGVSYAAASQVAVDLLGGPGRNPSEGEALLAWMEANEPDWRHRSPR